MRHALESLPTIPKEVITRQIFALRNEIQLAKSKKAGIDAAIKSREQSLTRLEAQLALAGSAVPSVAVMSARG